jgi:hypothetical protein
MVRLLTAMWVCVLAQFMVVIGLFLTGSPYTLTMVSVNFACTMFTFLLTLNVGLYYRAD